MTTVKPSEEPKPSSRKYTRRSEAQWRELIRNFTHSDLTLDAYCRHHGIAPSGFYTWRKRIENDSDVGQGNDNLPETLIDITPQLSNQTAPTPPEDTVWQVELELGQGRILRIKTA